MGYIKTTWIDEVLAGVERFEILDNAGNAVNDLTDLEVCQIKLKTAVTTPGTAVNAAHMNNLEDGIEAASSGVGLSVKGVSGNSPGDVTNIVAGDDGDVLRRSGTALGFGQIATAGIADSAITFAKVATPPAVVVSRASGVSATTTLSTFSFNSEDLDTDNMYTSGNPARVTFNTAGWYLLGAYLKFASGNTGYRIGAIILNGGSSPIITGMTLNAVSTAITNMSIAPILYQFAQNDYIQLNVQASVSTALTDVKMWVMRVM